ncbi:hypothetical protein [Streptomyces silvisoli]|uniref:Bulb-type lectin domain-containing protein n=1 Tax=Streptomyces silvisoli TaxID=3034235 RepID=A0ABT5ZPD8_9ACTN|nr:hypothetical protein [Streptomyces silvisoli]MDF3291444.1 hypothetical protein [Streptomyces silvisoli]
MAQPALIRGSIAIAATFAMASGFACATAPSALADTPTETVIPAATDYYPPQEWIALAGPGGFLHTQAGKPGWIWTKYSGGPDIPMPGRHTLQPGNSGAGSDVVATQTSFTTVRLQDMDSGTTTTVTLPTGQYYLGTFGSKVLTFTRAADGSVSLHVLTVSSGQLTDTQVTGWPTGATVGTEVAVGDANSVVVKYTDSTDGTSGRLALIDLASGHMTPVFGEIPSNANVVLLDKYVGWYLGGTTLHLLSRPNLTAPETAVQVPTPYGAFDVRHLAVVGDSLLVNYDWNTSASTPADQQLGHGLYVAPLTGGTATPVVDHVQTDWAFGASSDGAVVLGGSSLSDWGDRRITPSSDGTTKPTTVFSDPGGGPAPLNGLSVADGQLVTVESGSDPDADVFTRTIQLGGTPSYGPHTAFGKALEPSDCSAGPHSSAVSCAPPLATGDGRISQGIPSSPNDYATVQSRTGSSEVTVAGPGGTLVDSDGRYVIYDSSGTGTQYIGDVDLGTGTNVLFSRPISGAALWESTLWVANPTPGSLSAISLPTQRTTKTVSTGAPCVPSELQAAAGRWIYWSCGTSGPAGVYDLVTGAHISVPPSGLAQLGDGYLVEHDTGSGKLELTDVHADTAVTSDLATLPAQNWLTDDRRVTWAVDKFPGGGIAYTDAQENIHIFDPHVPASPASGGVLLPNQRLNSGDSLTSGSVRLVMQADGNLVAHLKTGGTSAPAVWASGTHGHPGAYTVMQPDGDLVVYGPNDGPGTGGALWSSNTGGNAGAYAVLQDDGNLVVYRQASADSRNALWSSGSYARPQTIASNATLKSGWWTRSQRTFLVMQSDGNLVMYRKRDGAAIWSSGTYGHPGAYAMMQKDGDLVVYRSGGGPSTVGSLWASGTHGHPGAYAIMQDDGNLVIYKSGGGPSTGGSLWASNTWRNAS